MNFARLMRFSDFAKAVQRLTFTTYYDILAHVRGI